MRDRRVWIAVATVVAVAGTGALPAAAGELPYPAREQVDLGPAGLSGTGAVRTIELVDVDGDADLDLLAVTANGVLEVYLDSGDGPGGPPLVTSAGTAPNALAAGDLDDDGHLDVVVTGTDGVVALLGDGDGTFAPPIVVDTASTPSAVALGDVDGDDDLDVVAGGADGAAVTVFPGAGDGTLGAGTAHPVARRPRALVAADLDGDTDLDIATVGYDNGIPPSVGALTTLLGAGDGSFGSRTDLAALTLSADMSSGDVDEDGDLDLLVVNGTGLNVSLFSGVGDGTFTSASVPSGGNGATSGRLADVDGDDHLDMVVTSTNDDRVAVRLGDGSGDFAPPTAWSVGDDPTKVRVGDVDGDGTADLLVLQGAAVAGTKRVTVLAGRGGGLFRGTQVRSATSRPVVMAPGDVDGDGDLDVVTAEAFGRIVVQANAGGRFVGRDPVDAEPAQSAGVLVDVDGDDDLDLVFDSQTGGRLVLHRNDGSGGFGPTELVGVVSSHRGLATGDLDGDGDTDLVVAASGVGQVAVLLGAGDGTFATPTTWPVGASPVDVQLADVDGDADLDVVTADQVGDSVSLLPGDGDGTFGAAVTSAAGDGPSLVRVADLDADGRPDVVTLDTHGETVSVLRGTASGLAPAVSRPVGENAVAFVVADLDGDGAVDVLVSDDAGGDGGAFTDPSTTWYAGDGLGGFAAPTHRRLWDDQPLRLGAADLDGSGALDLFGATTSAWTWFATLGDGAALPGPAWAPFASWADGVDDLHRWLLGRPSTTAERNLWVGRLQGGSHTLADLAVALRASDDHRLVVDPTVRLYTAYFLRPPDRDGIGYWIGQRRAGATRFAVSSYFSGSAEFEARYGTLTNRQFVERIYLNVLGRPGEASGVDFWTGEIDAGRWSRGRVMVGFADSAEYAARQADAVEAAVALALLAGVNPTVARVDALATRLAAGEPLAAVLADVLRSDAVAARATA